MKTNKDNCNLIIKTVQDYFETDIVENNRKKEVMLPKQISQYIIRQHLKMSYQKIGCLYGNTHATILNNCNKVGGFIQYDKYISKCFSEIMNILILNEDFILFKNDINKSEIITKIYNELNLRSVNELNLIYSELK